MSDSGDSSSMMEVVGSIAGDVGKSTGDAIKEAAATTFGKSNKPAQQQSQSSSGNGKMTPQEFMAYNRQKQIIQSALDKQYIETKQKEMMRQQANTQSQTQGKPMPQSSAKPGGLRSDIAETRSELRAGRKGG
jgi:hypothetical protein